MATFTTTTDLWVTPPNGGPLARLSKGAPVFISDDQDYSASWAGPTVYLFTTPDGFTGAASRDAFEIVDTR